MTEATNLEARLKDNTHNSKSFIYLTNCLGRNEELVTIYKIRTMIPNADEELQEALKNGIDELGKPHNDFRITRFGRVLRRYWLDELPQIYNLIRGDISLVGIRPKSEAIWHQYPEELKKRALRYKPGFLGVHYSKSKTKRFEELIGVETDYLNERETRPFLTQVKYFFKICYNIICKGVRSR